MNRFDTPEYSVFYILKQTHKGQNLTRRVNSECKKGVVDCNSTPKEEKILEKTELVTSLVCTESKFFVVEVLILER